MIVEALMSLIIPISPDIEIKLRERAASAGKAPEVYAADVLARDVTRPSLEEVLAPIQSDFSRSGMTEDELMDLGRRAVEAARNGHDTSA